MPATTYEQREAGALRQAYVTVYGQDANQTLSAAPSQLGVALPSNPPERRLMLLVAEPLDACEPLANRSYAGCSSDHCGVLQLGSLSARTVFQAAEALASTRPHADCSHCVELWACL